MFNLNCKQMKKKAFIAAAIILAALASSSCSKQCACDILLNGEVQGSKVIEKEDGKKCKDYNTTISIAGKESGLKCKNDM